MKPIETIATKLNYIGLIPVKWNDIYDTEAELLQDLSEISIREHYPDPTKGYGVLSSFQDRLKQGKPLTDKQMLQLKRLAYSVAYEKYMRKI